MIGYASWEQAEHDLELIQENIDFVMYNPEHWSNTPLTEQQNLEAVVIKAADFTHAHGWQFAFVPERQFAEQFLGRVAPYIDVTILQGQRFQSDPRAFHTWISEMIAVVRAANPAVRIFVQVGATSGTAEEMYNAIQTISAQIEGIAVWSTPNSLDVLQKFIAKVRTSITTQT